MVGLHVGDGWRAPEYHGEPSAGRGFAAADKCENCTRTYTAERFMVPTNDTLGILMNLSNLCELCWDKKIDRFTWEFTIQ